MYSIVSRSPVKTNIIFKLKKKLCFSNFEVKERGEYLLTGKPISSLQRGRKPRNVIFFYKPSLDERKSLTLALLILTFYPKAQESCIVVILDQKCTSWASLVAQWLRICLPMQGTRVRALVWEDPTCHGAAGPVSHNY